MKKKILISGSTWASQTKDPEQRIFLLTYQPFIEFIEKHKEGFKISYDEYGDVSFTPEDLINQFIKDWNSKFPKVDLPWLYGLNEISVIEVDIFIPFYIGCDDYAGEYIKSIDKIDWVVLSG